MRRRGTYVVLILLVTGLGTAAQNPPPYQISEYYCSPPTCEDIVWFVTTGLAQIYIFGSCTNPLTVSADGTVIALGCAEEVILEAIGRKVSAVVAEGVKAEGHIYIWGAEIYNGYTRQWCTDASETFWPPPVPC